MCATSACLRGVTNQPISGNRAPWRTSTSASIPPSSAPKFMNWPPVSSCASIGMYCLVGPPGVGKSHLAQAIGLEALKAGFVVLYRSIFDLVRELLSQETLAAETRLLNKYLKPDLLIIDDMGLKILPPKSGEVLLEIIMRRYENRSTMMTSNRPIEEWGKLLSDVPAAGAILDRLLHHAEIIAITGRSYRLQPKLQGVRAQD